MKEIINIIKHSNINYVVKDNGYYIIIGKQILLYNYHNKTISIFIRALRNQFNNSSPKEQYIIKDYLENKFNIGIEKISGIRF